MRIYIEVITPGNGKTYEIMMDDRLSVGAAKEKIIDEIQAYENGRIAFEKDANLYMTDVHVRMPDHRNLRKAGLRSGQTVFLL